MAKVTLRPKYVTVDGVLFPPFNTNSIRETLSYKPKPDDIFIATYPKCGTTWMQNIALYIFRKGKELEDPKEFQTLCPFIECKGFQSMENMPRPGAFKTHLPFTHVPYFPEAKYIYVTRNPKDCCVSMYYHTIRAHKDVYSNATFDDFFEIFMAGEVEYNDYFDHVMSWYPHRKDKNMFFTTYEDMIKDSKDVVLKVAAFLGQEYIDAIQKDNNILNNILRFSGFDYMKENLNEVFCRHRSERKQKGNSNMVENGTPVVKEGGPVDNDEKPVENEEKVVDEEGKPEIPGSNKEKTGFFRKGIVLDWKNHFSEEQSERMNKKFVERMQGTEIYDMYKSYMGV